jgi:hypothetical protein
MEKAGFFPKRCHLYRKTRSITLTNTVICVGSLLQTGRYCYINKKLLISHNVYDSSLLSIPVEESLEETCDIAYVYISGVAPNSSKQTAQKFPLFCAEL